MNAKRTVAIGALVFCVGLCWVFGQSVTAQQQPLHPAGLKGRFQMELNTNRDRNFTTVFVLDTETGHCWYRDTSSDTKQWTDLGFPGMKNGQ